MRPLFAAALLGVGLAAGAQDSISEAMDADVEGRLCRTNSDEAERDKQLAACTRVINDPQKFERGVRDLALHIRARSYRDLRRYDEAIRDYSTLIDISRREGEITPVHRLPNLYSSRANAHWENGDLAAAEADFTSAIIVSKRDVDRAGRYERRALFYVRIQQSGKALADFKQALKLDPNSSDRADSRLYVEELEKRGVKPIP
jgi:tetratricopeptide (TPR) repeat protein